VDKDKNYLGNINLKGKGSHAGWTEEQIKEFLKCSEDPIYFSEKYIKIVHVDHGFIPIKLYDYQKEIIEKITNNRKLVTTASRQCGKTTTATAVILHYVIFNTHKTIALLANKGDTAREILSRIKLAYEALPIWIQHGVIEWNKGSVSLENGCKIIAGSTSSSAIRGTSVSFLYIDECAHIENWSEFFSSVYPTISSGKTTKILMTSTPLGLNHFWSIVDGARKKNNGYEIVEVNWYDVPGRDEAWRQDTLASMNFNTEQFAQEFENAFLGSSGTLIEGSTLKSLVPEFPIKCEQGLSIYEYPQEDHNYVCIVDVSRGKGLDYSAFQILDVTRMPYVQVATFRDNLTTPVEYAEILFRAGTYYNTAVVLIEINDIGEQVSELLHYDYEYEGILSTESAGRSGRRISGGFGKSIDKGIRTTKTVKSIGCSILKLLVEQRQMILKDQDTIKELSTFSRKNNSYEAESGCHDDLVMCLVLFAWLSEQPYFKEYTNINTLKTLRTKTEEELMEDVLPFGFLDDGNEIVAPEAPEQLYSNVFW
jgi:hypothetical protein